MSNPLIFAALETQQLIQKLLEVCIEGGRISRERFRQQQQVELKPDMSWVTATDVEVETYIQGDASTAGYGPADWYRLAAVSASI